MALAEREAGKRCRRPRHRLPVYAEQSFVTGMAALLHKLDTDEINITLRLGLHPKSACAGNLRAPLSRFGRTHRQIRPQFNSVTAVLAKPSAIAPPKVASA